MLLTSCASYKDLDVGSINFHYEVVQSNPGLRVYSTLAPIQLESKAFNKRLQKKGFVAIPVKLVNETSLPIYGYNTILLKGGEQLIYPLDNSFVASQAKYNLTWQWIVFGACGLSAYGIPLIIPIHYAIVNKSFSSDLEDLNQNNIRVEPYSNAYYLLFVREHQIKENNMLLPILNPLK